MTIDISIIIPVYNGENSISISLDSLLQQTYSNFEVIIIDDGSQDNTYKVIEEYSNKDIRFKYMYQENAGVAMARNKGLELATGTYICFLDADDYYDNTFLEKMYSTIIKTNTDVCYCGYNIVTPIQTTKKISRFKQGDILKDYILGTISIHTTGWMIKEELLQKNRIVFSKGVSWGEDFEFFCEVLAKTNKISCVKEHLTNYRYDFSEDQLSAFTIDKIDKDYDSIKRIQKNRVINKNEKIDRALIDYRLSALITYRLIQAFQYGIEKEIIFKYCNKYKKYITRFTWNNGLRSMKLNINKIKLLKKLSI